MNQTSLFPLWVPYISTGKGPFVVFCSFTFARINAMEEDPVLCKEELAK